MMDVGAILFKSLSENDEYEKLLSYNKIYAQTLPTLIFEYINSDILYQKIMSFTYQGFIITSPRAVFAISNVLCNLKKFNLCNFTQNFATAPKTSKLIEEYLHTLIDVKCSAPDSASLSNKILYQFQKTPFLKPLLFVKGEKSLSIIDKCLKENNISYESIVCYDTLPNPDIFNVWLNIKENLSKSIGNLYLIFFSPSSFKCATPIVDDIIKSYICKIKFVALGPSTYKSITDQGYECIKCNYASPSALLDAISNDHNR